MHTSPSGRVYIGITCQNPLHRWKNGKGYSNNSYFFNAIVKYGWENFRHEILFTGLSLEEAQYEEVKLIRDYRACDERFGYNLRPGGSMSSPSEATRKKMSKAKLGKVYSKKSREKMSQAKKGKETWNKGRCHSEEAKRNMSLAHIGKATKPVIQLTIDGEKVGAYASVKEAARQTGSPRTGISRCLHGKQKYAGGFIWKGGETIE